MSSYSQILRAMTSALQTPVIVVLLLLAALTIAMTGTLLAEMFTERIRLRVKLPELIEMLRGSAEPPEKTVRESGLLRRQKRALLTLCAQKNLTPALRESLAAELLFEEKDHYDSITKLTDLIARLGPMFGLMGTLIPLGPGIIALGQGDTYTLSTSLLIAFDTTVAGLISAAVASVISLLRKKWYARYLVMLKTVMESLLEVLEYGKIKKAG